MEDLPRKGWWRDRGKGEKCIKNRRARSTFSQAGIWLGNEQLKGFTVLVGSGRCFAFITAEIFPGDHLDSVFTEKKKKSTHTSELKSQLNSALFKCASTPSLLCSSTSTPPTPPGRKKDNMNLFVLKSKASYAIRVPPWYLYWLLRIMIALKHECRFKLLNSHLSTTQRIWCKHYFCILQISFAKILPWAFLPFLFFLPSSLQQTWNLTCHLPARFMMQFKVTCHFLKENSNFRWNSSMYLAWAISLQIFDLEHFWLIWI